MAASAQVLFVLGLEKDLLKLAAEDPVGRKLQDAELIMKERAPKKLQIGMVKKGAHPTIYVYAGWGYSWTADLDGLTSYHASSGKEIFSFEYDEAWLKSRNAQTLDPALGFVGYNISTMRTKLWNFPRFIT